MGDERRYERRAIKERKGEDHMFDDKEKFITPAYKEKMEKLEKAEEEVNRRDQIDRMQSVEKQTGLAGFYRHLLNDKDINQKIKDEEREEQIQKELKIKQEAEDKIKDEEIKKEEPDSKKVKTEVDGDLENKE